MTSTRQKSKLQEIAFRLFREEDGALFTMEIILIATICGIGVVVGLSSFRDALSQEFGDVSAGLASIDHGYEYNDLTKSETIENMQFSYFISGSVYTDLPNFCEPADLDPINAAPMCMEFSDTLIIDEGEAVR